MATKRFRLPATALGLGVMTVLMALTACSDREEPSTSMAPTALGVLHHPLDVHLHQLLVANSDGQGLQFFRLPRSNQLNEIPQDPQNRLTPRNIRLGRLLYHETALGVSNVRPEGRETYACASCHFGQAGFGANLPQGIGEGGSGFGIAGEGRTFLSEYDSNPHSPDCQPIRTPSSMNVAYQELVLWNGALGGVGDNIGTEGQWTPGTPLESNWLGMQGVETQAHGGLLAHRMVDIELSRINDIHEYRRMFRAAFGAGPSPINRMNVALAVAAYERTLLANEAPFQRWLRGRSNAMTVEEKRGALLFFGDAGCVSCHTGPALNSMAFHALGMNDLDGSIDPRVNLEPFGGTIPEDVRRGRGGFTGRAEEDYAFKVPQLYNVTDTPYYGHGASFGSVREVVEYMNAAVAQNPLVPEERLDPAFVPLGLGDAQIGALTAFIERALHDDDLMRYVPDEVPSGNCIPVNDEQSRIDLGCGDGPLP